MKALVTGATGFIGGHLVEALVRRGDEVTVLVRTPQKAARLAALPVRVVHGDLDDLAAVEQAMCGQELVHHLAGRVAARDEAGFLRVNRDGTSHVVRAAMLAGVRRFLLVSSLAAAGPAAPGRPLGAEAPPRPVSAYGRSKLAGEQVLRESGLAWTIARPPMVYGPRDVELLRVFKLVRRGLGLVFRDGTQELSGIYAPDLVEALTGLGGCEAAVGRIYYPSHERTFTSRELVLAIGRALGREPRIIPLPAPVARALLGAIGAVAALAGRTTLLGRDKAHELLAPAWTADPAPLTRDTGWRARHDLAAGLGATAVWYRQAGWL